MLIPPEGIGGGIGEIDEPARRQRRQHAAEWREIPLIAIGSARLVLEEVALLGKLGEALVLDRDIGIFPAADSVAELFQLGDEAGRIRVAALVPFEQEARIGVLPGAPVHGQHVARKAPAAELACGLERVFGGPVIGARGPDAEAPARRRGRPPGQRGEAVKEVGRRFAGDEEKVERLVLDHERVAAMRPGRVADRVGDLRRRVDEDAPAAGRPGKGDVLVGEGGVDAKRVLVAREDELAAVVERAELLAQAVDRLARAERQTHQPTAGAAGETRQPEPAGEMPIGDALQEEGVVQGEREPEGIGLEVEAERAGIEPNGRSPGAAVEPAGGIGLGQKPIIGGVSLADPEAEHAFGMRAHLERAQGARKPHPVWCGLLQTRERGLGPAARIEADGGHRPGYFMPVEAMPVVMKRCRKAKTRVTGSRVKTVIAST